ncbi:hypothetical protein HDU85_003679 [Gaertneriomyces sp. JEL0708]|nr:hypothetical protein HDU85_003679 [Gaertneriomyces sp. JEL0708]
MPLQVHLILPSAKVLSTINIATSATVGDLCKTIKASPDLQQFVVDASSESAQLSVAFSPQTREFLGEGSNAVISDEIERMKAVGLWEGTVYCYVGEALRDSMHSGGKGLVRDLQDAVKRTQFRVGKWGFGNKSGRIGVE